jgi:hypothetical protein
LAENRPNTDPKTEFIITKTNVIDMAVDFVDVVVVVALVCWAVFVALGILGGGGRSYTTTAQ